MSINKTNIEWCTHTWNPVLGCVHHCRGCYAEALHTKRHIALLNGKQVPERYRKPFTEPQIFMQFLNDPYKLKKSAVIFVCSMGDLMGKIISKDWIMAVKNVMSDNRQHIFMLLTKNPERYNEFVFSENVWIGASIPNLICPIIDFTDKTFLTFNSIRLTTPNRKNKTFISIEPIKGKVCSDGIKSADLIIVGAMTGSVKLPPKREWVDSVKHPHIFYKSNIIKYFPGLSKKNIDVIKYIQGCQ